MDKTYEYAAAVADSIISLFKNDEEANQLYHYDLGSIDATKFFTGMIMGSCLVFNQITGENKNYLEFTHLCNQLIVQDMLEKRKDKPYFIEFDEEADELMEDE